MLEPTVIQIHFCRLPASTARSHPDLAAMSKALKLHGLSRRLGCSAEDLLFVVGDHGKPSLSTPDAPQFNLSHSRDVAVLAIGPKALGVDVEYRHRKANWRGIAERMFQAQELQALQAMPESEQSLRAVQLWTAKEAWVKATGLGIARLEKAPCMHWQQDHWCLPEHSAVGLYQAALSDEVFVSVCVLGVSTPRFEWTRWQWTAETGFESVDSPVVTELGA